MNLKGHLTVGNLINLTIIEYKFNFLISYFPQYEKFFNKIYYYISFFYNSLNNLSNIEILNIFLLIILGSIFPDLDQLIKNIRTKDIHYTKYHRQFSHSLILAISLIFSGWYINKFNIYNIYGIYLYYFGIGYLSHIFIDIFFGKGGIPLIYTKSWNSKYRLSIPLFDNEGYVANLLVIISYILNTLILILLVQKNCENLIYYGIYLTIFYIALQQKNTKNTFYLLFISILIIEIIKYLF